MGLTVGTSGWQYRDWRGAFYPERLAQRLWLEYYAGQFATVENNGTFYRLPSREAFGRWRERIPADFVMTVKASRYLTHIRRLRDPAEPVRRLLDAAAGLGDRLGPVLLQLPPDLRAEPRLLAECLAGFPATIRVAVEPRHDSWWTGEVRDLLAAHNAGGGPGLPRTVRRDRHHGPFGIKRVLGFGPRPDAVTVTGHGGAAFGDHRPRLGGRARARGRPDRGDGGLPAGGDRRGAPLPARRGERAAGLQAALS